ncbi:hypothetical protein IJ472_01580 [bacterium]|nr:hypothetical protein [bacterium]
MDKVLQGQMGSEILDGVFSVKENVANSLADLSCKKSTKPKTLSSHINYLNRARTYKYGISSICAGAVSINDDMSDKLTLKITSDLANAIDKNDVSEVKRIKQQYQDTKEFAKAKDFLNKKCKEVWDVNENKNTKMNVPTQALKALGITNQPSLDTLLADSLKYYEKDNGSTTVDIILSILANENINYTFEDIYEYLKKNSKKEKYKYNLVTVTYLATKLEYDEMRLSDLGIEQNIVKKLFKTLSIKDKIKCIFKNRDTIKLCYSFG